VRAIYRREVVLKNSAGNPFPDGKPRRQYQRVNIGRGRRPAGLKGPFFGRVRRTGGKFSSWVSLGDTLDEAIDAAEKLGHAIEAKKKGLSVPELDALTNAGRIPIRTAVETYLQQKGSKAKKTVLQYRRALDEFLEAIGNSVRFMDEITDDVLRGYKKFMVTRGYAGKTIDTRLNIVFFLLKKNGIVARVPRDEMPIVEEEVAVAYTAEELKILFTAMDSEDALRYKFFLGTGCRDKEVTYAAWQDLDLAKGSFQVRRKEDVGFTPKSHESRAVPLPKSLVALLKERKKNPLHPRWIFVNEYGSPDNHFLRKLKRIALHAGLNCGYCHATITKGRYEQKRKVEVSCKTDPVCEHWYLHRLRKTCATRWQENQIPVRTIQAWLGHKNLETTMIYLGVTDTDKLRGQIDKAFGD